ncbi:hypothetical protein QJQ45_016746 [Haematococcus lacustris]|nr:hypothetical protein QJQ45_016746 [Haematococcus lacustris]
MNCSAQPTFSRPSSSLSALSSGGGTSCANDELYHELRAGYQLEQLTLLEQAKLFASLQTFFLSAASMGPWAPAPFWHQACVPTGFPWGTPFHFAPAPLYSSGVASYDLSGQRIPGISKVLGLDACMQDCSDLSAGSHHSERQPSLDCNTMSLLTSDHGATAISEWTEATTSRQLAPDPTASPSVTFDKARSKRKCASAALAACPPAKKASPAAVRFESVQPDAHSVEQARTAATQESLLPDGFDMLDHLLEHGTGLGLWAEDFAADVRCLYDEDMQSLQV